MTKVQVEPQGQTNGDQMIQFTDTATMKGRTFSFDVEQNHLYVSNESTEQLEVKAGGETRTLPPGESWGEPLNYSSFTIRALTGEEDETYQFSVAATVYGLPGADRVNGIMDNLKKSVEAPEPTPEPKQKPEAKK